MQNSITSKISFVTDWAAKQEREQKRLWDVPLFSVGR